MKLTLIFLLFTFCSYAQNIKGLVLDEKTSELLVGAHVYLKNKKEGVSTNGKGEFILQIQSKINKNDTIYFSCIGYVTKKITFSDLKEKKSIVYLSIDIQNLKEVTIVSSKLLKPRIDYNKLASLKDGLYSFGSLLIKENIYVISGDASIKEDVVLEAFYNFAHIPNQNFLEKIKPDLSWQSFSCGLQIYDIKTDAWKISSLKFRKRAYHNIHYFNNKIYVLGGKRLSTNRAYEYLDDKIEVYDLKNDTILIDHTNPHQAVNFASFMYNDNIIVLGGSTKLKINGEKEYSNKVHLYNLESGYWYELNDMPKAKETKGVLIENKIYLIGGLNFNPLKEIETYDLITAEWKIEGELFRGVERPALTYNDNIIYIFEEGRIYTYNIETKELNEYLIDLSLKYSELFYANNMLYILGGFIDEDFSVTPSSGLFSIDLNEFEKTKIHHAKTF